MTNDLVKRLRSGEDGLEYAAADEIERLLALIEAVEQEKNEFQDSFTLRWKADMRGIRLWQEAHAGKELTWPSHCDLVCWLLEQHDAADATGYARGVRDAAAKAKALRNAWATSVYHDQRNGIAYAEAIHVAILALLPDVMKESQA